MLSEFYISARENISQWLINVTFFPTTTALWNRSNRWNRSESSQVCITTDNRNNIIKTIYMYLSIYRSIDRSRFVCVCAYVDICIHIRTHVFPHITRRHSWLFLYFSHYRLYLVFCCFFQASLITEYAAVVQPVQLAFQQQIQALKTQHDEFVASLKQQHQSQPQSAPVGQLAAPAEPEKPPPMTTQAGEWKNTQPKQRHSLMHEIMSTAYTVGEIIIWSYAEFASLVTCKEINSL